MSEILEEMFGKSTIVTFSLLINLEAACLERLSSFSIFRELTLKILGLERYLERAGRCRRQKNETRVDGP